MENGAMSEERDLESTQARLTEWFGGKMPTANELRLSPLNLPGAGVSNETFLCDLSWREGGVERSEGLVIRLEPADFRVFPEYDLAMQYSVMQCLRDTGVLVPAVRWLEEDASVLGCPFYVMQKIEGEIPNEVPPYHSFGFCFDAAPERRAKMWWSGIDTLARVHALDWESLGLSILGVPKGGTGPIDRQLDYYERFLEWTRGDVPQPILDAALTWLRENRYPPERVALCWGDARLPNVILREDEVVGVLDWEMAFLGDPESDLAWWLFLDWHHSDGLGIPRLEGFPGKEETIQRYEELTGWKVEHSLYQEIMAAFRFGVIMVSVARNMTERGISTAAADMGTNNPCTQRLATLLELPPPGGRAMTRVEEITVRVQFHLTGAGAHDWYLVADKGDGTRHEGTVQNPDVTVTASAADWAGIQSGELDRTQAYLGGKLVIEGDLTLMLQLEDMVSRLSGSAPA
jgi:aminoglycoside phosphotransferase (APT) family kinase protein/putative sterol carrier protein